ncbi:hypothetical protein RFI_18429, partial [Reticulomyxa filosa]
TTNKKKKKLEQKSTEIQKVDSNEDKEEENDAKKEQKKKNRCWQCQKKIPLAGRFGCKCDCFAFPTLFLGLQEFSCLGFSQKKKKKKKNNPFSFCCCFQFNYYFAKGNIINQQSFHFFFFVCVNSLGYVFCSAHRFPDSHSCGFDYKEAQIKKLDAMNPVVAPSKVDKI